MIVSCVLQFATQSNDVIVVADDTDILILLIHHWNPNMADVYFQSNAQKMWKIHDLVAKVGGTRVIFKAENFQGYLSTIHFAN